MTVRNWLTKLLKKSNKVEQAFYVTERDKGGYNNLHVRLLAQIQICPIRKLNTD